MRPEARRRPQSAPPTRAARKSTVLRPGTPRRRPLNRRRPFGWAQNPVLRSGNALCRPHTHPAASSRKSRKPLTSPFAEVLFSHPPRSAARRPLGRPCKSKTGFCAQPNAVRQFSGPAQRPLGPKSAVLLGARFRQRANSPRAARSTHWLTIVQRGAEGRGGAAGPALPSERRSAGRGKGGPHQCAGRAPAPKIERKRPWTRF